jgi:SAM-dependent methyltransferase
MSTKAITPYNEKFFDRLADGSLRSARAVVPIILDLVGAKCVVDFGCGEGAWLKACLEHGVESVVGLDGDYVKLDKLRIDRKDFQAVDLRRPIRLDRRFDLAMCLEVAEHLPRRSARGLVESLAAAAPVVLFSASLPGQGGTSHINEQWPVYWERLFAEYGMRKYDVVRPMIWTNRAIELWYRQNIYLYCDSSHEGLDALEHFEPDFCVISSRIMSRTTFGWDPLMLKPLRVLRRLHSYLSRWR